VPVESAEPSGRLGIEESVTRRPAPPISSVHESGKVFHVKQKTRVETGGPARNGWLARVNG
jgi:hypothetical protein